MEDLGDVRKRLVPSLMARWMVDARSGWSETGLAILHEDTHKRTIMMDWPLPEKGEGGHPQKTITTQWREAILGITMDGGQNHRCLNTNTEAGDEAPEDPYAYYQEGDEDDVAQ
uniref:Uncharacterized protein n=1 Tax=Oryza sativa subsp. japonica TaxID=39947 RepID=Q6ZIH5_ORYSJ|nr:hypothetical protein [Oryza sativa Japonica Group]